MEVPDIKYYQTVIDTQTQAHILKGELQDFVNEVTLFIKQVNKMDLEKTPPKKYNGNPLNKDCDLADNCPYLIAPCEVCNR